MFYQVGLVTGGSTSACNLIFKMNEMLRKNRIPMSIPFVVINDFLSNGSIIEERLKTKVVRIENDGNGNTFRERIYENHLREISPYPTKRIFFIEYEKSIPLCYSDNYECYVLQPSIKNRVGTWEFILGEIYNTKSDVCGCYIVKMNSDGSYFPVMYYKFNPKHLKTWKIGSREEIYNILYKEIFNNMLFLAYSFLDCMTKNKFEIIDNKLYIDTLLVNNGVDMRMFVNKLKGETYERNSRIC